MTLTFLRVSLSLSFVAEQIEQLVEKVRRVFALVSNFPFHLLSLTSTSFSSRHPGVPRESRWRPKHLQLRSSTAAVSSRPFLPSSVADLFPPSHSSPKIASLSLGCRFPGSGRSHVLRLSFSVSCSFVVFLSFSVAFLVHVRSLSPHLPSQALSPLLTTSPPPSQLIFLLL